MRHSQSSVFSSFSWFISLSFLCRYPFAAIHAISPAKINSGNARYSKPPATMAISRNGNSTTVTRNFDIPHAALMPKNTIFPNTHIMQIINNNDNIFLPSLWCYIGHTERTLVFLRQFAYRLISESQSFAVSRISVHFFNHANQSDSLCRIHSATPFPSAYSCRFSMFSV